MTGESTMKLQDPSLLRHQCLIDGHWVDAASGHTLAVTNPADGSVLGTVPDVAATEVARAITAAAAAQPAWQALPAAERAQVLRRWFDLISAHTDDLARIITSEQGKPLAEAQGEIRYAASFIVWFAEEATRVYGDLIPAPRADHRLTILQQPVGVTAAITPWNFPAAMITRKVAPALAAGCTMVVRPSEYTPFTALALGELSQRAGLPAGVLQIVTGDAQVIGGELTRNPTVRKLSFTGSTKVGRLLMAQCAPTLKRLSLELGGNAPFIVFADADLDAAVTGAMQAKFRNGGQTCISANRFLVDERIAAAFTDRVIEQVARLRVGPGHEDGIDIGPLITPAAATKVLNAIKAAIAAGATLRIGGSQHACGAGYVTPTVLTNVTPTMAVACDELFGPVVAVQTFTDEAEAIALANGTESGLAAYCYTTDLSRSVRVSEALEFGMVGLNTGLISHAAAPFGGIKQSGFGREGSRYGLDEYLQRKYVCTTVTPLR